MILFTSCESWWFSSLLLYSQCQHSSYVSTTFHINRWMFLERSHQTPQPEPRLREEIRLLSHLQHMTTTLLHSSPHYCALQYIINLVWSTLTWLTTMVMCTLRGKPVLLTSCSWNVFFFSSWLLTELVLSLQACMESDYIKYIYWMEISCWL